jgi:hypothetical protein
VKGAGLQRVKLPPGNWFAPPGKWDEKVDPRSRMALSYRQFRRLCLEIA